MTQPPDRSHGRWILLVDDDLDTREVVTMALLDALEGTDTQIATAANGEEALAALEKHVPSLVLLDLMMPIMSGAEFLDAVRKDPRYCDIPIIVMSAWSPASNMEGARAVVRKPVEMKRLLELIDQHASKVH